MALKKIYFYLVSGVFSITLFISCKHVVPDQPTTAGNGTGTGNSVSTPSITCDPNTIYFQQQVLPILISNCTMSGCHDAASRQDGVILTTYNNIIATAEVRAGQPYNSKLYKVLVTSEVSKRMPYNKPAISQDKIDIISKWIQQGAQNSSCQNACDTANVTFTSSIKPIITAKCQGCHSSSAPAAGYDYSTYPGIKARVDDKKLWGAINHMTGYSPMPKNGPKLSDCELTQIKKWIDAGAPNN